MATARSCLIGTVSVALEIEGLNVIESLWIAFAVFLVVDLVFVLVRASLLNARLPYLVTLREQDSASVERTVRLLEKPRLRVSLRLALVVVHFCLLGITIWLFLALTGIQPGLWQALALLTLAALLLLIFEIVIEGLVLPRAETLALRLSLLAAAIDLLVSPLSSLLMLLLGSPTMLQVRMAPVTESELKSWVEEGQAEGSLEQGERRMIYSIFQFGDTLAREIMVPRIDVLALDINTPVEEAIQALTKSGHSRVPVYEEAVDNVMGLLYAKDLLKAKLETADKLASLRDLLRPAYFVPEAKKVDELLREMQARSVHVALVVDEYGGIAGLVTMEDIVEEIVGEIRDEYDQSEELLFQKISDKEFVFQGRIDLDDFNEIIGANLTKDVADTLGGFIYGQIGRVPAGGEQVQIDDILLKVETVSGRRIHTVRAFCCQTVSEAEGKENEAER
jgi:CBS domain containing-hemolysin-like protein